MWVLDFQIILEENKELILRILMCFLEMCWFRSTSKDRKRTTSQCADTHCRYSAPVESLFLKLKIKLQEAKTIPFTKPKNVTQENLKTTKEPSDGTDFTESQHYFCSFPFSERFCTPFPVSLYFSRTPNHSNILVCTQYQWKSRGRKADLSPLVHPPFRTQMNVHSSSFLHHCGVHSTCCPCPPCSGVSRLHSWGFFWLCFFPLTLPQILSPLTTLKKQNLDSRKNDSWF